MKTRKIISMMIAIAMLSFVFPQNETKAAYTNYQRAKAQYEVIYNVSDYGIDTAGKKDSGSPISNLIIKLNRERTDDKTPIVIYMPSGKYKLNAPIKINKYQNVHLIAENDTQVTSGKKLRDMVEIQNTSNVSVVGGKWDGANKTTYNFKLYNAADISISQAAITRASERGIHISKTTATLNGIKAFKNKRFGVSSAQSAVISIMNSSIYGNGEHGVVIAASTLRMEDGNNKIYNNGKSGVSVSGSSAKLYASGNSFTGNGTKKDSNGHGVGVAQSAYAEISNNKIEKNKQCGISLISKAKAVVTSNTIKSNGRHGIGSAEKCTLIAKDNTIVGNKWHGIMIRDNGTGVISNNTLSKNKVAGLSLEKSTATADGNTIYKNSSNGIIATASTLELTNNSITKNKAFGVYTDNAKVKVISGNVITSNSKGDIDASGSSVKIGKDNTVKKIKK